MQMDNALETLCVPSDAKNILRRVLKVASSDNIFIKQSVKDLFIISPHDVNLSKFARVYESIIVGNKIYRMFGKTTYLELAFPKNASPRELEEFYNSPKLAAATTNDYTGVFLISFEQWNSYQELVRDSSFNGLVKFIENNKQNISYIFHVMPDFSNAERLFLHLSNYINLLEVELRMPNLEDAIEYIEKILQKANISLMNSECKLKELLLNGIDNGESPHFSYTELDQLAANIVFELVCSCETQANGTWMLDDKTMDKLTDTLSICGGKETYTKIGFR